VRWVVTTATGKATAFPVIAVANVAKCGADSGEKHEPAGDIDTVSVDSLKALDPNRPIREADID
jgi:hypothetical protein